MRVEYFTYFKVIALPVLLLVGADIIALIRALYHVITKKENAYKGLLISVCLLGIVLFLFRSQLLPAIKITADLGAQTCHTEGVITEREKDRTYSHNQYTGCFVTIDSQEYYAFDTGGLREGYPVEIEYLPTSHMIISWKWSENWSEEVNQ
ncbi:MAG: hypothetical protein E7464_03360 [Ruminococcaceae bacterium]|nr:hypothetical protein [Oscillospiraceae bacterium]